MLGKYAGRAVGKSRKRREKKEAYRESKVVGIVRASKVLVGDEHNTVRQLAESVLEAARMHEEDGKPLSLAAGIAAPDGNTSYLVHLLLSEFWNDALVWAGEESKGETLEFLTDEDVASKNDTSMCRWCGADLVGTDEDGNGCCGGSECCEKDTEAFESMQAQQFPPDEDHSGDVRWM